MTNTNTGETFAILLIFSSLTDVSFPQKQSKIFLNTRERTDSSFGHLRQGEIRPSATIGEKSGFHQCFHGSDTQNPSCIVSLRRLHLTACRNPVVAPSDFMGNIALWRGSTGDPCTNVFVLRDEAERLHVPESSRDSTILMYDSFVGKDL